ncbi:hypothetical protein [Thermogemmatispora sp.]|uniref:hypothetical protein n=1 Tax=Thermogemmatispora sp. TaxID=1968838 RepID=UPI001D2A8508|nr:hypothetical protein [Thermogemmatispora sp.]MBX5450971.1 hypothetical protein [Thermogemmatispora sp.]
MILWVGIVLIAIGLLIGLILISIGRRSVPARSPEECARLREQLIASGLSPRVAEYVAQGNRLEAVRAYREETGLGLKEATRYIDELLKQGL